MKKISTSTLQRPMVICLLAAFCCLLWGSAFPAVKIGYGLLSISSADSAEQLIFAGLRFFFAGVVTVLFHSASLRRLRLPARSSLWKATKLGLIQTLVQYALFYIGMAHTSGVKGSVLMAVHVFFAILISAKLFHYERLNAPKLLGCLCGFGGVLLINLSGGGLGGGFTLLGDGAVLLAALANGFSISLFKRYAEGEDTLTLCGYQFIVGGGLLLLTGLCFGGTLPHFTGQSLLLLGYMVLLSAVAQTIWSALTRYNPVGRVAVYGFLNPVFGVLLSALLLREGQQAFTPYSLAALVLVCVGIFVVNRSDTPAGERRPISSHNRKRDGPCGPSLFPWAQGCYIRLHIFGYSASGTGDAPPRRCQRYPPTPLGDGEGFQVPAADQRRPVEGGL